jgi:hypothetical protein
MNRIVSAMVMMALSASLAQAQSSAGAAAQGQGQGNAAIQGANAGTDAQASLVENTSTDAGALKKQLETKAQKVSAKSRARADAKIEATSKTVDTEASQGETKVADRLSTEFGMTADALEAEKASTGASWGNLMIAHTLAANATSGATVADLIAMKQGGMGWGQIAAGLGLNLGEVISAVASEGRVASGTLKADGKVAVAHGEGAKAGLGLGVKSGGAKVGATAGVGAGVKIKP